MDDDLELVGAAEAAELLGVTRQRVAQLAMRDDFPRPVAELSAGRIWRRAAIAEWQVRQRTPVTPTSGIVLCSFCGKDQKHVKKLIAGPNGVCICEECVNLCVSIIWEEVGDRPLDLLPAIRTFIVDAYGPMDPEV